jgi:hypothetical protein
MSSAPPSYVPRLDTTPERELDALAAVYRFILDTRVNKEKGGPTTAPDSAKGGSSDSSAKNIIPKDA